MRVVRLFVDSKVPTNQSQLGKLAGCSKSIDVDTFLDLIRLRPSVSKTLRDCHVKLCALQSVESAQRGAVERQNTARPNRNARANKDRDRDPDYSEAPPTPPGMRVRTGRFISSQ